MIVSIEEATLDASGDLRLRGWAAGAAPVESVEVVVAGLRLGEAEYGLSRPDVAAERRDFVGAGQSGFAFVGRLDEAARTATQAFVIVRVRGGAPQAAARTIERSGKSAAPPADESLHFHCDRAAIYDDGAIEIAGWAAHRNEIDRIAVALDGETLGEAQVGVLRPDVGKALPDIPSAGRCGFDFGATRESMPAGEHELMLTLSTKAGDRFQRRLTAATQIARAARTVERQDIRLHVDSPRVADGAFAEPVRRLLAVEGWAIARQGVAAIEVFLDGVAVGAASRGVRRLDIGASFPDWPDALTSGFTVLLPRKLFSRESHKLRIAVRDRRGETKDLELRVAVAPLSPEEQGAKLRALVPQAEIDLKLALIDAAPPPVFAVAIAPSDDETGLDRTLESLAEQAYPRWRAGLVAPIAGAAEAARAAGVELSLFTGEQALADAAARLLEGEAGRPFVMVLRAGDRLGADALLEFALDIATRPEEDFHYADDARPQEFLKPEWSPDLLLSMNYIGRAWCASLDCARRAGLSLTGFGDYDAVLRLTEAAREIGRAPLTLLETGPAGDAPEAEIAALKAAMARRGLRGGVRATAAPGVYRLRRQVATKGLVSIVIPTIARGGFLDKCLASLKEKTWYDRFEIVLVDNIADPDSPEKEALKRKADCVVEYPGPFNWSKLNNLGAEAALGDYLLFLNDDVEAIEPRWLHALMEHAQREEVGVVGPRLLYPDGRVQHAGMFLMDANARHAFRFCEADEPGDHGLALAVRNVAALTGAAMLMRRAAFDEVGGFDESHAIVNNDVDLCLRLWRAGLRVVYTPHATLIHHEMASRSALKDEFDERAFAATWRHAFGLGDPFFHPRLSREDSDYAPEPEPTRALVAGRPLLARDKVKRILVQKLDHVGDFITGFPALRRLRERFPQAEIHVLAPSASAGLAKLAPEIDNFLEFNFFHAVSQQGRLEHDAQVWAGLAARLKPYRFDIALDLRKHVDTRDALKHSGAKLTAGFDHRGKFAWLDVALEWDGDQPFLPKRAQVADDYVALVEAVSLACESERQAVAPPPREAARALPGLADLPPGLFDRPVLGVHPAAGNVLRQWPPEHFALLIDLIVEAFDVNVALIGAANEAAIAEAVFERVGAQERVWSLVGRTKLGELPALLGALRLFVGNNSGPHHLAAAMGVATVGVHSGVVSAREWGPLGPLAVAVQRDMSCGPCYLEKPVGCARGLACLQGLRPAEVFRVCEQMLGPGLRRGA
jgi:ADP-heptose:LPS heptosyltransferase/GT2 family glycosyltransferase